MKVTVHRLNLNRNRSQSYKRYDSFSQTPDLTTHMKKNNGLFDFFCARNNQSDQKEQHLWATQKPYKKCSTSSLHGNTNALNTTNIKQQIKLGGQKSSCSETYRFSKDSSKFNNSPHNLQSQRYFDQKFNKLENKGRPINYSSKRQLILSGNNLTLGGRQKIQLGSDSSRRNRSISEYQSVSSRKYSIQKITPNTLLIRKLTFQNSDRFYEIAKPTNKPQIANQTTQKKKQYEKRVLNSNLNHLITERVKNSQTQKIKQIINFNDIYVLPKKTEDLRESQTNKCQKQGQSYLAKSEVREVKSFQDIQNKDLKRTDHKNGSIINPELEI